MKFVSLQTINRQHLLLISGVDQTLRLLVRIVKPVFNKCATISKQVSVYCLSFEEYECYKAIIELAIFKHNIRYYNI